MSDSLNRVDLVMAVLSCFVFTPMICSSPECAIGTITAIFAIGTAIEFIVGFISFLLFEYDDAADKTE